MTSLRNFGWAFIQHHRCWARCLVPPSRRLSERPVRLEGGNWSFPGSWCLDLFIQYLVSVSCKFRITLQTCVHAANSLLSAVLVAGARPTLTSFADSSSSC